MLCFNYTVGFSWSVAVLSRPLYVLRCKDQADDIWQASPRQYFSAVSMHRFPHRRPEPLFIPKLQSRFADFPCTRYLHTKGYSPRRPDAVISTVSDRYALTSFQGTKNHAHDGLPRRVTSVRLPLELGSSEGASPLGRYDGSAALVFRREAMQCVAAFDFPCWDLSQLPFRLLRWLSPRA